MKISASIVTYNSRDEIDNCLSSLSELEGTDFVLYVVDNASRDGTADHVEENYPWVKLIRSERNAGFGAAHNIAVKLTDSDCHIIINPDITLDASQIPLMAEYLEIELEAIRKVYLAGAFGTFMDPEAACRIGLLPQELAGKIQSIGNAAGSGAKLLACDPSALEYAQTLVEKTEFLELASVEDFQFAFAENMRF